LVDGRNALDPHRWRNAGWTYRALGRPAAAKDEATIDGATPVPAFKSDKPAGLPSVAVLPTPRRSKDATMRSEVS
jgi:hypothetical protein